MGSTLIERSPLDLLNREIDLLTEALQREHERRVQAEELLSKITRSSKPASYLRNLALEYLESL